MGGSVGRLAPLGLGSDLGALSGNSEDSKCGSEMSEHFYFKFFNL